MNSYCNSYECAKYEQCDECFAIDHAKECDGCTHYDHQNAVSINRIPLMVVAEVMQTIYKSDVRDMVWANGKIVATTLPSLNLKF